MFKNLMHTATMFNKVFSHIATVFYELKASSSYDYLQFEAESTDLT